MRFLIPFVFIIVFLDSCTSSIKADSDDSTFVESPFFRIIDTAEHQILEVVNPLDVSKTERYFLTGKDYSGSKAQGFVHSIEVPVSKVACFSTSQIAFISALHEEQSIVGSLNPELIYSPLLQQNFVNSKLKSIGGAKIDVEQLLSMDVDLVFAGIFDAEGMKKVEHMRALGIKVILVSEFLEKKPLEKSKWIKFFSYFYDDQKVTFADSLYQTISSNYTQIKAKALESDSFPEVMTGLPWKGNWFVPGGGSFQSAYFEDASARYIFDENDAINSLIMDFESMLKVGMEVPYWLNVSDAGSLQEIKNMDERFGNFRAYRQKNVYNNNARKNKAGGNDYWESGALRADWVLKDLAAIFHPELFPEHHLFYYQKLEDVKD